MSNTHDSPTDPQPNSAGGSQPTPPTDPAEQTPPGPDILAERTLSGIFVHLLGLLTFFIGPLVVYAAADHDFTRENARNAANWQLFYLAAIVGVFGMLGVTFAADALLPDPVVFVLLLAVFVGTFGIGIGILLNIGFVLVASGKAIFGHAWTYPIAPSFFDRREAVGGDNIPWWTLLSVYAVATPPLFATLAWEAFADGPDADPLFWGVFALLAVVFVLSFVTFALLYKDIEAVRGAEHGWMPDPRLYLGAPVASGIATYPVAAVAGSISPAGDAVYGYMAVLWVAAVVYLVRRVSHGR
ncbi:DUF4870 family protein [Natronomonas pharaonis DSM 2160]|uniref:DUF4870 family protein n=1 Tax=Natronomonas pharaonis (strain ATCC 35678 / DSM 2160 / CIP 103997 / JCM 8858 / NBRC 14720 / NCIMB 2260 / Gabara) TaxID=348780 RepID=A0A1U7EVG7_NATPD|nr:DUF4870 domain-containing protein [Natronomonas pharaonis]CAI49011.1 DUF4870 family protein [Natronomonas pharaonis DSM 2160]